MSETIPGGNIDQSNPAWGWCQNPGLRNPNPIPQDAPTQSTVNSVRVLSNVSNPAAAVTAPNAGTLIVTTKDSSGKTLTVHGTIAGVTINIPG